MIIIPARLASTRFENKILKDIGGVPMFIATAKRASEAGEVAIAVDDESVREIAKKHGFRAIMSSPSHNSGTDRINEIAMTLGLDESEIIINLQADEPFFEVENLKKFIKFASDKIGSGSFMASAYKNITNEEAKNPNLVKVILDKNGDAIYFSRSLIPYPRSEFDSYLGHIGIYAYSVKSLREFCLFDSALIENIEKLEQLRAIYNGKKIAMTHITTRSIGIDTIEDYQKALSEFVNVR